jgi:hypothetical protein
MSILAAKKKMDLTNLAGVHAWIHCQYETMFILPIDYPHISRLGNLCRYGRPSG